MALSSSRETHLGVVLQFPHPDRGLCPKPNPAPRRELYEVDLVLTKFDADDMYDTMKLVQSTDLFMGMHGAGFTNLLFMNPVRRRREVSERQGQGSG